MSRHQRRTARAVEDAGEPTAGRQRGGARVHRGNRGFTLDRAGGARCPLARSAAGGPAFHHPAVHRNRGQRLGRRPLGRIRSFPWDAIPAFSIDDRWLELRTWEGQIHRWFLRATCPTPRWRADCCAGSTWRCPPTCHRRLGPLPSSTAPAAPRNGRRRRKAAASATPPFAPPGGRHSWPWRSPAAATFTASVRLAEPFGVGSRSGFSLRCAVGVLGTADPRWTVLVVGAGCGLLGVTKLHGVFSARLLAHRAGAISPEAEQRWRRLVPVGLVLSLRFCSHRCRLPVDSTRR